MTTNMFSSIYHSQTEKKVHVHKKVFILGLPFEMEYDQIKEFENEMIKKFGNCTFRKNRRKGTGTATFDSEDDVRFSTGRLELVSLYTTPLHLLFLFIYARKRLLPKSGSQLAVS